nr:glycosyltransferase family 2 protein [Actinomycetota bacterium]
AEDLIQVLVVDGRSDDGTRDLVNSLIAELEEGSSVARVTLLDNAAGTVPQALNIGIGEAGGDIIVRVDGHCEIQPDHIRSCIELLDTTDADNVGGIQKAYGDRYIGRVIALATSSPFGVGPAKFHYSHKGGWVDTVYLGAYRREIFQRFGLFDEEMIRNQDDEFNFRLTQGGGRIWLDPSIQTTYHVRPSLSTLWRQYFEYGLFKVRVIQKREGVASLRHLVPFFFVMALLVTIPLGLMSGRKELALVIALPYGAANIAVSLYTVRREPSLLPLMPLTFSILHFSYGLGFAAGLWRWRRHFAKRSRAPKHA